MIEAVARRWPGSMPGGLTACAARFQQRFSDRVHAGGDALAREHGWAITAATGRLGFGARVYRDPRFGPRATAAARPGGPSPEPGLGRPR
ncbi:MAG: hypothetical protein ACLQI7_03405 [Streptosporangiaceae bacterium]|jgi:hypothetical protein